MSRSTLLRLLTVLFAAVLVLGACGGDDGGEDGAPDSATEQTKEGEPLEETDRGYGDGDGGGAGGGGKCGGSGGQSVDVEASNFQFKPDEISAPAGEQITVNFKNSDDVPHTFTISDMSCDTSSVAGGASSKLSFTMPDAETEWICTIHTNMMGTLVPK